MLKTWMTTAPRTRPHQPLLPRGGDASTTAAKIRYGMCGLQSETISTLAFLTNRTFSERWTEMCIRDSNPCSVPTVRRMPALLDRGHAAHARQRQAPVHEALEQEDEDGSMRRRTGPTRHGGAPYGEGAGREAGATVSGKLPEPPGVFNRVV